MRKRVLFKAVCGELAFDCRAAAAHACAVRVAALSHKAIDYPVKAYAVIKTVVYKLHKVFNRLRSVFRIKRKNKFTAVFHLNLNSYRVI